MRFIGFYEVKPEDFAKAIPKFKEATRIRNADPDRIPKIIFPNHIMSVPGSNWKGFTIYEDATEEQLNNLVIFYHPEITFQFIPLHVAAGFVAKFLEMKKSTVG